MAKEEQHVRMMGRVADDGEGSGVEGALHPATGPGWVDIRDEVSSMFQYHFVEVIARWRTQTGESGAADDPGTGFHRRGRDSRIRH